MNIDFCGVLYFHVCRIHMELNGGAWCPKEHISKTVVEFIEINLRQLKVLTLVETQGRFGNGQVWHFLRTFSYFQYMRNDRRAIFSCATDITRYVVT